MNGWQILSVTCIGPRPTPLPTDSGPTLLVFPAEGEGEALAGRYAAATGAMVLGRLTQLGAEGDELIATRSSHGGRLTIDLRVTPGLVVATAHDHVFCTGSIQLGEAETLLALEQTPLSDQKMKLEAARIVVGGGRGLDADCFTLLEQIADAVGGAVAASLPAVDLGLAPVSRQVGQSGKFVNPEIYLAVGMSGTPQHFAGVGARARIIALNKDRDAPIFGFAEAGAAVDATAFLPLVAKALADMESASS